MPFKHSQTGYYYCEIVVDGYGQLPRLSLGTRRKREAQLMEEALRDVGRKALVRPHLTGLLEAVEPRGHGKSGLISPADILRAKNEPQGYERLLSSLDNPPIGDILDDYLEEVNPTREDRHAQKIVRKYVGNQRYSHILDTDHLQSLLEEIQAGEEKKRSSVCRYEKRLVSKLIRWRSGSAKREEVFDGVEFARGDDTRRLRTNVVTPKALQCLIKELREGYWKEGDEIAPLYARIALSTGATIGPLSRSVNKDLEEETENGECWGRLYLRGTKKVKTRKGNRDRFINILPSIWKELRPQWNPDEPEARAFALEYPRFYSIWKKAVERAGLDEAVLTSDGEKVRLVPHDLRSVFSAFGEEAGVTRTKISQSGLGHDSLAMTDRYLKNKVELTREDTRRIDESYE